MEPISTFTTSSSGSSITDSLNTIKFEQFGTSCPKLQIIPTIDISKGKAVLVNKGNVVTDNGDPFERAKDLSINPIFQIADIDAAKGTGNNREIIKQITTKYACYVGGGIRTQEIAEEILSQNAKRVVIGTQVIGSSLIENIPSNRMIVAFDIDDAYNLLLKGRTKQTSTSLFEVLKKRSNHMTMITITFHSIEGTGEGLDMTKVHKIKSFLNENNMKISLAIAGGIKSVEEIKTLLDMEVCPQFGYALWNKLFTLGDLYSSILDYGKLEKFQTKAMPTLVPCLVVKSDGLPLALSYSSKETIKETIDTRECVFYSRSKRMRWKKGTESGNVQYLLHVSFNCDRTSLLYVVKGNNFCSKDQVSCFNYRNPSRGGMKYLEEIITKSLEEEKNKEEFANKLMENKKWLICKLLEEVNDLAFIKNQEGLISCISDLIYYLTLYCVSSNISIEDIYNELARRHFIISKPKYIINPIPPEMKIGICLNKDQENDGFKFLKRNGLAIELDLAYGKRSLKYNAKFTKDPSVKLMVYLIKPKDIYRFFDYNYMDAVVCFEDLMKNVPFSYEKVALPNEEVKKDYPFAIATIYAIGSESFDLDECRKSNRHVSIYTDYYTMAQNWIEKNGLNAKVVSVSGESENFLINGLCDLCICTMNKEEIGEYGLKIIDEIYQSELGLFSKVGLGRTIGEFLTLQ